MVLHLTHYWKVLREKINEALSNDGFLFVMVVGERGKGKSTLGLNILKHVYGDNELVKKALVFSIDDFDSMTQGRKYRELRLSDGRIAAVLWDDIGLHFSTYQWFTPHARQRMTEFIENFQTVREDVAVIIGTAVELEILPPKLRSAANYIIDCQRRGLGKLFGYSRYLWLRKWKVLGKIEWSKTEPQLYSYYKQLKRKAHRAKQKARIVSRTKLAKIYAELLRSLSNIDFELLYGLGIVDKDGNTYKFDSEQTDKLEGGLVKGAQLKPSKQLDVRLAFAAPKGTALDYLSYEDDNGNVVKKYLP